MANEDNERDIIRDAIIGTEKEIFGGAFEKEDVTHDESGDRSLEAMGEGLEGQHEPEDEEESESVEGEAKPEETDGKKPGEPKAEAKPAKAEAQPKTEETRKEPEGRVPPGRLREETKRAQAAEAAAKALESQLAEKEAAHKKELDAINAKFEGVLAAIQKQQPAQPKPAEAKAPEGPPDLFEDPKGFAEYMKRANESQVRELAQRLDNQRVENSLQVAHARHGDAFTAAFQAVTKLDPNNEDNRNLVRRMYVAPNPGEALVAWHKRNEALREVGTDPAAYKARIAEETRKALMADPEFRKQFIEELRGEAEVGDNGRPRTTLKLPASLNRAPGGNTRSPNDLEIFDGSEQATFNSAWTT